MTAIKKPIQYEKLNAEEIEYDGGWDEKKVMCIIGIVASSLVLTEGLIMACGKLRIEKTIEILEGTTEDGRGIVMDEKVTRRLVTTDMGVTYGGIGVVALGGAGLGVSIHYYNK